MEMQMRDGSWEAFMADRFPENLDDEIKKFHEQFYLSAHKLYWVKLCIKIASGDMKHLSNIMPVCTDIEASL
eukprot:12893607-Prorocentrum_lima.AAC.1